MHRAVKFPIYPSSEQATLINKTIGCARLVYNCLLDNYKKQFDTYNLDRETNPKPKLGLYTDFKGEHPYLAEVDSIALSNARVHIKGALDNFFRSRSGKRKGKPVRFPQFKKKGKTQWRYTTNNQNGTVRIEGDTLKLPKVGWVKMGLHRTLDGRILSCTVELTRDGKYYVSLAYEAERTPIHKQKDINNLRVVGIDMSMSGFAVDSDTSVPEGTKPKYERNYRKFEAKLARLQRSVSRKEKGSSNRDKARQRLAKMSRHVANKRKDYAHKMSRYYADNYDVIVLEDIDMQGMSRTLHLGKSVHDLGFGMFRQYLSYKCKETDSVVIYADKWFASSKTCHECGAKNELLRLSDREWVCPECGSVIDRDLNAALNLRDYFRQLVGGIDKNTVGTTGIYASGEVTSTLRETLTQVISMNEEAPSFRWG